MGLGTTVTDRKTSHSDVPGEEYPYSDGRVLMESDPHANSIVAMRNQLQWHFHGYPDVYVAGSMAVFYRKGDKSAVVEPDLFVVVGCEKRDRRSYRVWDEGGVVPGFVVEVASPSTSQWDATGKRAIYRRMGVREYWRFDPTGRLIRRGLAGWLLVGRSYRRIRHTGKTGWYRSDVLGLDLRGEGWLLRFRDPLLGRELMTHSETSRRLDIARFERDEAVRGRVAADRERDEAVQERDEAIQRIRELEARLPPSVESA